MQTQIDLARLRFQIQGAVQGVGFRPFIYRLATDLNLVGWVKNSTKGLWIEVEGMRSQMNSSKIFAKSMKYVDEYRTPEIVQHYASAIDRITTCTWTIMEICGGQTHAIVKF